MSSEAKLSLIEQPTDLSIRASNSGTDRHLDEHCKRPTARVLDLDATGPPELRGPTP